MTTYIALLRGINVGGHKMVAMADLREMCTKLGFVEPRTLLQSGNLVFRDSRSGASLERLLELEAEKQLGVKTEFFVRSAVEWQAIIAANPFPVEAKNDPGRLLVMALKQEPDAKSVKALQAAIVGREVVRAKGKHAYIVYPDGVGTSRLTMAMLDSRLGTRGTGRNWNTVLKVGALTGVPRGGADG
jgi:uncharacterized protein (DUF1697 family)